MNAPADADRAAAPPLLERRLGAAACDMVVVGLSASVLVVSFNPFVQPGSPWVWAPAAAALIAHATVEGLTGITIGKALFGVTLRDLGGRHPGLARLLVRATLRLLPVGMLVPSLFVMDGYVHLGIVSVVVLVVVCYFPICYLTLARAGRTMFDAVTGTVLVRRSVARHSDC